MQDGVVGDGDVVVAVEGDCSSFVTGYPDWGAGEGAGESVACGVIGGGAGVFVEEVFGDGWIAGVGVAWWAVGAGCGVEREDCGRG